MYFSTHKQQRNIVGIHLFSHTRNMTLYFKVLFTHNRYAFVYFQRQHDIVKIHLKTEEGSNTLQAGIFVYLKRQFDNVISIICSES